MLDWYRRSAPDAEVDNIGGSISAGSEAAQSLLRGVSRYRHKGHLEEMRARLERRRTMQAQHQ